jgi:hypothetical protein
MKKDPKADQKDISAISEQAENLAGHIRTLEYDLQYSREYLKEFKLATELIDVGLGSLQDMSAKERSERIAEISLIAKNPVSRGHWPEWARSDD